MPTDLDVVLLIAKLEACCRTNLLPDNVNAGYHLCHRVLNLNPGIHLHEVEVIVLINEKLHGADAAVTNGLGGTSRSLAHCFAQLGSTHR